MTTRGRDPGRHPDLHRVRRADEQLDGGSYTTAITTQTSVPATIDTGTTPAVTLAANNTAVTVNLAKSLTFTVDTTAFELDMDPSLGALADQTATVGLTVQTNANSGYTLAVTDSATGLQIAAAPATR